MLILCFSHYVNIQYQQQVRDLQQQLQEMQQQSPPAHSEREVGFPTHDVHVCLSCNNPLHDRVTSSELVGHVHVNVSL